jgi:P27 family predicted phage terminase small subunit
MTNETHDVDFKLEPPGHLTPAEAQEFRRLVAAPGADYRESELRPLERYCQLIMSARRLHEIVEIEGEILHNAERGTFYSNPNFAILQNRENRLMQLEIQLGLTVKSRRDKVAPKTKRPLRDRL